MPENDVDSLFVEFLRRGPAASFDAFCAEHAGHAEHAAALRELHASFQRVLSQCRAAGLLSLPSATESASPEFEASAPSSSVLLRRIALQGSKGARYRLQGELARGGMGVILRVWDDDLGRELAMKVVLGSEGEVEPGAAPRVDERRMVRFLEEAQITGQLDHPGVVPVHELGLDSRGQVYFTMRLVKGRDFGRILELVRDGQEGWTRTRALDVLLRVCDAMAYAHAKGVVHRDLKPANVMVGKFGEVYVMDWGLARVIGRPDAHDLRLRDPAAASSVHTARREERHASADPALVTMEGDVVGTPAYMPLEQARGHIDEISARSDVYAIGAMLYHLLAGEAPYVASGAHTTNAQVLNALIEGPPAPPRTLRDDVPAELEAICEKAMARDMSARYAGTQELADDLRAFLEGRVVRAYETGAIVELRKWVARNQALAAAAAAALLFLIAGLIGSLWQKSLADRNAALAAAQAVEATRQGDLARANATLADRRAHEADDAARRAEAVRDFLRGMLSSANPFATERGDVPVSSLVNDAARRLDEGQFAQDPQSEFALRRTLGETYRGLGLHAESEHQLRRAVELFPQAPTSGPSVPIELELDLAQTLNSSGRYAQAQAHVETAQKLLAAANLADPKLPVRALYLLAACRYNQGATQEAIELSREAIELRTTSDASDVTGLAGLRSKLSFYLEQQGRIDDALVEVNAAIDVLRSGPPGTRIEYSSALWRRAGLEQAQRHWKNALADLNESLRIREELLGPDSLYVADIIAGLANCEQALGQLEQAEPHARRCLELRRRFLGEHKDTATALTTLSLVLSNGGRRAEARELLEEALAMRRKVLAPDNAGIGDCLRRLAWIARDEGDLAQAETLLLETLENWTRALRPDHPDIGSALYDLARVLREMGRLDDALPRIERAVELRRASLGDTAGATSEARDELVMLLFARHDWQRAETLLRELLPKYVEARGADSPIAAYTGAQLGAALVGQKRFDEAEPLLLAGWKAIGENPRMWAVNKLLIADNLVELYTARGDETNLALYREKAAALRK